MKKALKIGLALGSGAARGWAHIGIIKSLAAAGIKPDVIAGTSIGALVGAASLAGNINKLESRLADLDRLETAQFFKLSAGNSGFVNKNRLQKFLTDYVAPADMQIADLPASFASVATDLHSGREVWNTQGNLLDAVWSSISLPGLFKPVRQNDRWIIDGGLVNPVPVSVCRALGADIVIAANLNSDILGKHFQHEPASNSSEKTSFADHVSEFFNNHTGDFFSNKEDEEEAPSFFDAIFASVNIVQDRITRSRMAGDPPEILLQPRLANIGLLEFYRSKEAIMAGEQSVQKALPDIRRSLGLPNIMNVKN